MNILELNPKLLFGIAGIIGGGVRGLITFYKLKTANKKVTFDVSKFSDTIFEGIVTGVAFSIGLPVGYAALGVTALASAGLDSYTNKLGIKIIPLLRNFVLGKKKR